MTDSNQVKNNCHFFLGADIRRGGREEMYCCVQFSLANGALELLLLMNACASLNVLKRIYSWYFSDTQKNTDTHTPS